jgi:hypothetical protein
MQGPHSTFPDSLPSKAVASAPSSGSSDRAYQTLVIAAILIVLGSLWVF